MKFKIKKKKVREEKVLLPTLPDVDYNTHIPAIYRYNSEDRANIIQAGYAEVGEKYVSHDYNNALELLSKDTRDSSDLRAWKLKFKAYSYTGDTIEVNTNGLYPIIQDPESLYNYTRQYTKRNSNQKVDLFYNEIEEKNILLKDLMEEWYDLMG